MAQELRKNYLSYNILKVQRNEYITIMLVYASIALNIYLQILNYMYTKREKYGLEEVSKARPSSTKSEEKF